MGDKRIRAWGSKKKTEIANRNGRQRIQDGGCGLQVEIEDKRVTTSMHGGNRNGRWGYNSGFHGWIDLTTIGIDLTSSCIYY